MSPMAWTSASVIRRPGPSGKAAGLTNFGAAGSPMKNGATASCISSARPAARNRMDGAASLDHQPADPAAAQVIQHRREVERLACVRHLREVAELVPHRACDTAARTQAADYTVHAGVPLTKRVISPKRRLPWARRVTHPVPVGVVKLSQSSATPAFAGVAGVPCLGLAAGESGRVMPLDEMAYFPVMPRGTRSYRVLAKRVLVTDEVVGWCQGAGVPGQRRFIGGCAGGGRPSGPARIKITPTSCAG